MIVPPPPNYTPLLEAAITLFTLFKGKAKSEEEIIETVKEQIEQARQQFLNTQAQAQKQDQYHAIEKKLQALTQKYQLQTSQRHIQHIIQSASASINKHSLYQQILQTSLIYQRLQQEEAEQRKKIKQIQQITQLLNNPH